MTFRQRLTARVPQGLKRAVKRAIGVRGTWLEGKVQFADDGIATLHTPTFLDDPRFQRAYTAGRATGSWGDNEVAWRAHVACWCGARALQLEGDFIECGVNRGGLAETVMTYVGWPAGGRQFWLCDTFEGLDSRFSSEGELARGNDYEPCWADVSRRFGDRPGVRLVRGAVPETLDQVKAERVAFLSIDMNCAEPEVAAIEHFWPRLVSGAAVLLDDYGWATHEEQRVAMDALALRLDVPLLCLPTGQGLILRP